MTRTTILDRPLRSVTKRLIDQFGKDVVYLAPGGSVTYDRESGKTTVPDPVEYEIRAVFQRVKHSLVGTVLSGTEVKHQDEDMYVPALGLEFTPDTTGIVRDGGVDLQILDVEEIRSGEMAATWRLLVSR